MFSLRSFWMAACLTLATAVIRPEGNAGSTAAPVAVPAQDKPPAEAAQQPSAPASDSANSSAPPAHPSRFRKLLNFTKQSVEEGATGGSTHAGPKAIDAAGLRNILPDYDPDKPLAEQFPHVAVTVLKAPPMWADTYLTSVGRGTGYFTGCFTLKAVVWSDADHSKTVGPFDWCSPRDVEIQLGPAYMTSNMPSIKERMSHYLTGTNRTDGPRPPATLLPNDRPTQELEAKNNPRGAAGDLNMDDYTRLTLMFANLRHGMGQAFTDHGDFRVWIVRIE